MRNVSSQISLRIALRIVRADTFRQRDRGIYRVMIIHRVRKVSVRVSLCCILRLIRVDTIRNVGFLVGTAHMF